MIYSPSQDPLNTDGTQHGFAPDMKQGIDGRYYLFYSLNRSPIVSVAVCDTPAEHSNFTDMFAIWMALFMDKSLVMYLILILVCWWTMTEECICIRGSHHNQVT